MSTRAPVRALAAVVAVTLAGVMSKAAVADAASVEAKADADPKIGYWFYKKPPEPEQKSDDVDDTKGVTSMPPPPSEDALLKMPVKKVEKLIEDYRQYALYAMTTDSVKWYFQMQDFARRRSRAFMNVSQVVMLENPGLNMNTMYPMNEPGRAARVTQRDAEVEQSLEAERNNVALIMLSQEGCGYCEAQRGILKFFVQKHGWQVREVDIHAHPEAVARFGTSTTPSIFLIMRGSKDWMPIAVGVQSMPELEDNSYRAIRMLRGDIGADQWTTSQSQEGGLLDPRRK